MTEQRSRTRFGRTELPQQQHDTLRRARRLEWVSIAYLLTTIAGVYLVMGASQAMRVAWVEDLLSLVPPISFLVASRRAQRPPTTGHPYGHHRAVGTAHLAAAVALLTMGVLLVFDSAMTLVAQEHPPIGTIQLFGHTVWAGWPMVAMMTYSAIGPVILGRLKLPLAATLHDKVLQADAAMNKADWMTAAAAIVGILGVGFGLWWADAAAALVIATSIVHDGWTHLRGASNDLADSEARTVDDDDVHPVIDAILERVSRRSWVARAGCRVRDLGHVFHAEVFVVPLGEAELSELQSLTDEVRALDWKLDDVVVIPVPELPAGVRTQRVGLERED